MCRQSTQRYQSRLEFTGPSGSVICSPQRGQRNGSGGFSRPAPLDFDISVAGPLDADSELRQAV